MPDGQKGSVLGGAGAIAFGVLTVLAMVLANAPGGSYTESDVAAYVSITHLPVTIVAGYAAMFGVLGLISALAHLRRFINPGSTGSTASAIFWAAGIASAASFAVGWGLVTGVGVAAAEGGSGAAAVGHPAVYMLSDTSVNVLYGSGAVLLGFALIALVIGSKGSFPAWLRWSSGVAAICAIAAPAFFPAPIVPLWAVLMGIWLLVGSRRPAAAHAAYGAA